MNELYKLEEITGLKLDEFNREKTLVVIPVGILEYHAHHLPYGTDLYENIAVTDIVVKEILEKKDYSIIQYPNIPLGVFGIENLSPEKFPSIGSFVISEATMIKMLVELIGKFADFNFKKFVIISFHGAPDHCTALNKASDFLEKERGIKVLPVMSYLFFPLFFDGKFIPEFEKEAGRKFTDKERDALLHFVHAEIVETSAMLYLHPSLVDPIYKNLDPIIFDYDKMFDKIKELDEWKGYVGAPALAKKDIGKAVLTVVGKKCASIVEKYFDEISLDSVRRYPEDFKK